MTLLEQLTACRFLPVVTARDVDTTVHLTSALALGGMTGLEITLRTPAALSCISALKAQHPGMLVAAGTVLTPDDALAAREAGADFCVSPGISEPLLELTASEGINWLPGVATASELMLGLSHGLQVFKLFPAVPAGGHDGTAPPRPRCRSAPSRSSRSPRSPCSVAPRIASGPGAT